MGVGKMLRVFFFFFQKTNLHKSPPRNPNKTHKGIVDCSLHPSHLWSIFEVRDGVLRVCGDHGHRIGGVDEKVVAQNHVAVAIT